MSNANNPVTEVIAFMIEYDWRVCLMSIPQYSFTIQKPASLTCEKVEPPMDTARAIKGATPPVVARHIANCTKADSAYGAGVAEAIARLG